MPDIDPAQHRLVIHGLVKQPLVIPSKTLSRYRMVRAWHFLECGGNSAPMFSNEPVQATVQALHGLVSCAEWTGVLLSTLLEETGIDPKAKWLVAEGADSPRLNRSVPVKKAMDDAMIALYQNGERLMPGNGYPMRLLLPGYEGNMNVKYLRRIKLVEQPAMSITRSQDLFADPAGQQSVSFPLPAGSEIIHRQPSLGHGAEGAGLLRKCRHRLFRHGKDREGDGLGRRREELGPSRASGAGTAEGVHALPHAMALGWNARDSAEQGMGRSRQRPADPRRVRRRARANQEAGGVIGSSVFIE